MKAIPEIITQFLLKSKIATICFNDDNHKPYSVICYFVYDEHHRLLLFKSSFGAFHEEFVRVVTDVAGTVLPEQVDVLKMKGLQFSGKTLPEAEVAGLQLESVYHKRYPFGRVLPGYVWAIRPDFLKFTDNTLGFGKKTTWSPFTEEAA